MLDFSRQAMELAEGKSRQDIEQDTVLRLALTHLVELVGEAAARVPKETRDSLPQLSWSQIVGMRNRLIHGYDFVDYDILWGALTEDIPGLRRTLEKILEES